MKEQLPTGQEAPILVTGASRGLGQSIALNLAQKKNRIIGTATTQKGANELTKSLVKISPGSCGKVLQQEDEESVINLFKELTQEELLPLVLVANAGITSDNLMLRMKTEEWQRVLDINLKGAFLLCKNAVKYMIKAKWGRIILLGSVVGSIGNLGQVNYAAAKAGLLGLGKSMAREFASRNITVNIVSPGFIETDMTEQLDEKIKNNMLSNIPLGRYGRPDEVASLVSFLARDNSGYITGQTLHINGGINMS